MPYLFNVLAKQRESNVLTSSSLANRVWDLDGNENVTLRLRSPGISVCWHPEEALKVTNIDACLGSQKTPHHCCHFLFCLESQNCMIRANNRQTTNY